MIVGPQGGPFVNSSAVFTLHNSAAEALDWSASTVPSFVQLDRQGGTIPANSQIDVTASLNSALATSMPPGMSEETLTFHNDSAPQGDIVIDTILSISNSGTGSTLLPSTDFSSQGPAGGPFQPAGTLYALFNMGSTTLNWQATPADPWVSVQPASGQLAAGAQVNLSVSIVDSATGSLSVGQHQSSFDVVDASNNATLHTRGVTLDVTPGSSGGGWTIFTPSNDTRQIYVSSSTGNDANDGLSASTPKRTVGAGRALLRDGFPDWLLLKKGDVFDYAFGAWSISGRSLAERMLLSSYGTGDRPTLRTGTATGIWTANAASPNHIAIVGLHFVANTYTGSEGSPDGIAWMGGTQNFLLEDCFIERYYVNLVVQAYPPPLRHTNMAIRRNVIADAFTTGTGNAEGVYADAIDGLLMEENVIDHNGWVDSVPGSLPTIFRHNVYVQNGCTGVIFRGNIVAGTDGAQIRPGGVVTDNVVSRCVMGLHVGVGTTPEPAGITVTLERNTVVEGYNPDGPLTTIIGLRVSNLIGGTIADNIVSNATSVADAHALWFSPINTTLRVAQNVTVTQNIFNEAGNITFPGTASQYGGNTFQNCVIQSPPNQWNNAIATFADPTLLSTAYFVTANNEWDLQGLPQSNWISAGAGPIPFATFLADFNDTTSTGGAVNFPDPGRALGSYNGSLGGTATYDAFMTQCRLQSKDNWRTEYMAVAVNTYIRAGFGL